MPTPLKPSRRAFVLCAIGVLAVGQTAPPSRRMTAAQAHLAAQRGELLLIDVRTRNEWRRTGVGAGANPVSMHEPDFMKQLDRLTHGDMNRPIAVICATGGRSNALQGILTRMGYTNVFDVPEGMQGNGRARGWIASGLPVVPYKGNSH